MYQKYGRFTAVQTRLAYGQLSTRYKWPAWLLISRPDFWQNLRRRLSFFQLFLRRRTTFFKLFLGVVLSQAHRNFIAEWRDEKRWEHLLTGRSERMFATSISECVSFDYCPWYLLAETVSLRCTGYHLHVVGLYSCRSVQRRRRLRPWTAQDV